VLDVASPHESTLDRAHRRKTTDRLLERLESCPRGARRGTEDELIAVNVVVAHDVARRYRGRGVADDDLDQVACIGLVKAVRGYDPDKATDFLGYAVPTIRGEVRRYFRDHGWVVRPPRSVQELQPRITRARGELWQRFGREPKADEVADELDVEPDQVREAMGADGCFSPSSVDAAPSEGATLADRLGSDEPGYARVDARVTLRPLLRTLTDRERRILEMRFRDGCTQAEIGHEIGVTQMQVSRLLSGLFHRLRGELQGAA
jgi:RNA polymerase sigma-B factor